ncbi:hypothetical protein B2G71_01350 [Novosphingobium sp. PC22D]|uniref:hypothetical protein n=1 Tax=Novosphingobium sp. PC22D TaxID=1962403 RepID=UPI000BF1DE03|nr:hypothetical protein [Novosphingobium sp. PC22D]PEQ14280.1 hypothetical protein B2G71_01350 [Novosphingobium sp. PC22D]
MEMMILYLAACLACWSYALRYGGIAARKAFALFLVMTAGTILATADVREFSAGLSFWSGFNGLLFASDLVYFLGLCWVATTSQRYWPIWSSGFALLCVLTHFGPLVDPFADERVYRGLETFWQLPILVTMVVGIWKDKAAGIEGNPGLRTLSES